MPELSYANIEAARARIAPHLVATPLLRHDRLDAAAGRRVWIKAEVLQRTGSFKLRGALNAVLATPPARREAGFVAFSSGNHAQAVACAAASVGAPATIFMPVDAPRIKRESTEAWGARIEKVPRDADRGALAAAHAERTGATLIPPFDHPEVIAGQGTLALEVAEAAGETLGALLVGASGGGLAAGSALALRTASPATRVWCVEPAGHDDHAASLAAGAPVAGSGGGSVLCDSLLAARPGALTFPINRALLGGALVVSDAQVLAAMRFAFLHLKLVVEPGGAVGLAALLAGLVPGTGPVCAVLTGGNVDPETFCRALTEG